MLTLGLSLLLTTGITSYFLWDTEDEEDKFIGPVVPGLVEQPLFRLKYWWHGYKITNPKEAFIISGVVGYLIYNKTHKTLKKL